MSKFKRFFFISMMLILVCSSLVTTAYAEHVTIHRDSYGVPHIYAEDMEGLYYGWGYAAAQDRLFQLDMLKRNYYGQVSELFGEDYLALDIYWRKNYPSPAELKVQYENMKPKYKAMIKNYTRGINAWIEKVKNDPDNKKPYEYFQLGIEPKEFTEVDTAAALMANLGIFVNIKNEMIHLEFFSHLKDNFGEEKANILMDDVAWIEDSSAYTTMKEGEISGKIKTKPLKGSQLSQLNTKGLTELSRQFPYKSQLTTKIFASLGYENITKKAVNKAMEAMSYSVVAGTSKSATGNPWLMAGPQVDYWVPGMLHEVGLHGAGHDVVGTAMIGGPFLMFGESKTTAFTTTAGADNVVDIYEEKLNPEDPLQYWYKGEWRDMEVAEQIFRIKDQESEKRTFYKTVHGPVIAEIDTDDDGQFDVVYTQKVACEDSYLSSVGAYNELSFAQTTEEFIEASKLMTPPLNFYYADNKGNIGFFHAGKFPIRPKGIDPRFPLPGTGEYEWEGFVAHEDKPQIINPASDYFINWNNKPAPGWSNGDLTSVFTWASWSVNHRSNNLDKLFKDRLPINRKDMEFLVHEIADADLRAIAMKDFLLEAIDSSNNPELEEVRKYLAKWDNYRRDRDQDGYIDYKGEIIFKEWWPIYNEMSFADEFGPFWNTWYDYGGLLYNYGGYSFQIRTIIGDKAAVPVKYDWYNGLGWKNVMIESLEEALAHLEKKFGTDDISKWKKHIKTMPFPSTTITGAPTSFKEVHDIKYMDRGSENHIVECTWPVVEGQDINPPGQNGFVNKDGIKGDNFDDQLELYANWEYKDMLMRKGDVLLDTVSTEILIYDSEE